MRGGREGWLGACGHGSWAAAEQTDDCERCSAHIHTHVPTCRGSGSGSGCASPGSGCGSGSWSGSGRRARLAPRALRRSPPPRGRPLPPRPPLPLPRPRTQPTCATTPHMITTGQGAALLPGCQSTGCRWPRTLSPHRLGGDGSRPPAAAHCPPPLASPRNPGPRWPRPAAGSRGWL